MSSAMWKRIIISFITKCSVLSTLFLVFLMFNVFCNNSLHAYATEAHSEGLSTFAEGQSAYTKLSFFIDKDRVAYLTLDIEVKSIKPGTVLCVLMPFPIDYESLSYSETLSTIGVGSYNDSSILTILPHTQIARINLKIVNKNNIFRRAVSFGGTIDYGRRNYSFEYPMKIIDVPPFLSVKETITNFDEIHVIISSPHEKVEIDSKSQQIRSDIIANQDITLEKKHNSYSYNYAISSDADDSFTLVISLAVIPLIISILICAFIIFIKGITEEYPKEERIPASEWIGVVVVIVFDVAVLYFLPTFPIQAVLKLIVKVIFGISGLLYIIGRFKRFLFFARNNFKLSLKHPKK